MNVLNGSRLVSRAHRVLAAQKQHPLVQRCFASVGDKLPSVELHHGFPPKKHNLADFAKDKSILLIPNYLENQDALRKEGIHSVIIYSVNDSAVVQAWAKDQKTGLSMLQLMGDPKGDLTKALDMEMTHPGPLSKGLYGRCKRHAIYAVNGEIKVIKVAEGPGPKGEEDPAGDDYPEATLAEGMLSAIREVKGS